MFMFTARITKTKIVIFILILLLAVIFLFLGLRKNTTNNENANMTASTAADRQTFLKQFGWDINAKSETVKAVTIPTVFDNVFIPYNTIQKAQGFDLTKYKGKQVNCYTYPVTNYPEKPSGIYATILIYNNKVVGGDVHSSALDGFMHGFDLTGTGMNYGQYKPLQD